MISDPLIVVFDETGDYDVYESASALEASMEAVNAAEESYAAFTLAGYMVELSFRGNLASNASTLACITSRQDLTQLATCVVKARMLYGFDGDFDDLETLINAGWAREWERQQRAWWNYFRKGRLPSKPRTV